jgi:GcrA cell cycle regulator
MQAPDWKPAHCDALREYVARGMSYAAIAEALNAKFGTGYTRNAALGRAKRMGLQGPERPGKGPKVPPRPNGSPMRKLPEAPMPGPASGIKPLPERAEPVMLRCVGISPRLLDLVELEAADCRYPYGGDRDGEPIVFCGHPRRPGSSYCAAHFRLTRGPGTASERAAGPVTLRLVEAA